MLAILNYQLKSTESEVKELEQGYKKTEQHCQELENEL